MSLTLLFIDIVEQSPNFNIFMRIFLLAKKELKGHEEAMEEYHLI